MLEPLLAPSSRSCSITSGHSVIEPQHHRRRSPAARRAKCLAELPPQRSNVDVLWRRRRSLRARSAFGRQLRRPRLRRQPRGRPSWRGPPVRPRSEPAAPRVVLSSAIERGSFVQGSGPGLAAHIRRAGPPSLYQPNRLKSLSGPLPLCQAAPARIVRSARDRKKRAPAVVPVQFPASGGAGPMTASRWPAPPERGAASDEGRAGYRGRDPNRDGKTIGTAADRRSDFLTEVLPAATSTKCLAVRAPAEVTATVLRTRQERRRLAPQVSDAVRLFRATRPRWLSRYFCITAHNFVLQPALEQITQNIGTIIIDEDFAAYGYGPVSGLSQLAIRN